MGVIVVGADFTPCSASGLRQAIRIAAWRRATVQAVHAIEPLVVMDLEQALSPLQTDIRAGLIRDAGKAWKEFTAGTPGAAGLELAVEIDHPVSVLLRRVREQSAELLVLGTHGTIQELMAKFRAHDFNMFPVVDARGVLRGLVTKLDLLRTFRPQMRRFIPDLKLLWAEHIEDVMSRGTMSVEADDPITVAVDTMIEARLRSLPVVKRRADGPVLVGIVSRTDVLPYLTLESDEAP